jgi:hypothetical protein
MDLVNIRTFRKWPRAAVGLALAITFAACSRTLLQTRGPLAKYDLPAATLARRCEVDSVEFKDNWNRLVGELAQDVDRTKSISDELAIYCETELGVALPAEVKSWLGTAKFRQGKLQLDSYKAERRYTTNEELEIGFPDCVKLAANGDYLLINSDGYEWCIHLHYIRRPQRVQYDAIVPYLDDSVSVVALHNFGAQDPSLICFERESPVPLWNAEVFAPGSRPNNASGQYFHAVRISASSDSVCLFGLNSTAFYIRKYCRHTGDLQLLFDQD